MKGKYKKTIALLMTLIMVLSINITALAEGSANPSSIQGKVVEKMELPAGDADSAEVETQDETAGEDGGDMTTEDTDIKEEAGEEGAAEGEDVDGAGAEDGEAVEGEDEKDEEDLEAGDGAEETAGEDKVVDEVGTTEENGGEQEAIAENGQDGIDGGKVAEGVTEAEEQLDLGDNPDNITADEAYIENLGFYYPALIKMYRMMAQSSNSDEITWPAPGAINLIKTADPVEGEENQWEITLTVEGKNVQKTSKVVLVIDKSGSMKGKKMANTILAAQEFVDKLLLSDGMTEIAVVSFDKNAHIVSYFVGHGGKDGLKTEIGKIEADGGTNIQAGIHQAQILLDAVTADNKVIVLLGDGEATYSYKVTQASGITLSTHKKNQIPDIIYDDPEVGNVDYDNIVGSGSDYALAASGGFPSKVYRYQIYCNESGHNHGPWTTTFPTDNGIPTIWEAGLAKDKGTKIYSIALNAGTNGNYVLNECQDSGYYELNSSELDVLSDVFDEIAGQIAYAANNAIVIDPMGQMFNLVSSLEEIYVPQGTAEITATGEIKWDVGTIKEDDPAIMKYKVMIKDEAEKDKLYPTNGTTTMEYKDINEKDAEDEFEVPEVSVSGGKILYKGYLVNDEGEPISEVGIVVARPDLAKRLYDNTYSNDPLDYNKTYIVAKSEIPGYKYMGYVWNDSNGTQDTVSVLLLATAPTQIVWFAYAEKNDVTVTFEENYLDASSYHRTIKSGSALKTNMPPNPNRLGYSFMGWYPNEGGTGDKFDSDTIVTSDITVYAQWAANTDTAYKVEHYLQNLAGDDYTLKDTDNITGMTGTETAAEAKTYTGFTVKGFNQVAIAADGTTIVKIYYDRNTYKLTYAITGSFFTNANHAIETYKFGEAVTAVSTPSQTGYTFVGWAGVPATMPAEDVTVTGYYTANTDTAYTVEHYLQNLAGDGYILEESESKAGTTDTIVTAVAKSYTGFSENAGHADRFASGTIAADGSLVLKLYYDRVEFTVTFKDHDDKVLKTESVRYGGDATPPDDPEREGYTFTGWDGSYKNVVKDETVVATYTPITNLSYTVNYLEKDTGKALADPKTMTGQTFGKVVTENAIDIVGYNKVLPTSKSITIAMSGNVITFYYTAKCLCYTVNYLEQGTNKVLAPAKH
ncbi:MAG: VWA domain-containing protein, partial [Clostridiales bacterium]|nr:VWA domain-containing protein [Clostridiales bacterium]